MQARSDRRSSMKGQMLPVIYRQARAILAIHGADRQVVEAELAPLGLRPLLLHKERALVSLGWFDYVDSSIGPYRELVVATPALPRSGRWTFARFALNGAIPNFILDLPVTSELACTLGR